MYDNEQLALAAHLHVVMRRKIGRVIDTEWLLRSPEYAREIIGLALAQAEQPELHQWARKLQVALAAGAQREARDLRGPRDARRVPPPVMVAGSAAPPAAPAPGPAPTPASAPMPTLASAATAGTPAKPAVADGRVVGLGRVR